MLTIHLPLFISILQHIYSNEHMPVYYSLPLLPSLLPSALLPLPCLATPRLPVTLYVWYAGVVQLVGSCPLDYFTFIAVVPGIPAVPPVILPVRRTRYYRRGCYCDSHVT